MIEWYSSPALRRRCQAGLNKGEAAHKLKRAVLFHERGEIRDRSFESQAFRASGLNLVVSAIVHWNTVYLDRAITQLKREGRDIPDTLSKHISPLSWEHINLPASTPGMPNIRCPTDFDRSVCQPGYGGSHKLSFRSPLAYDFGLLLFWPRLGPPASRYLPSAQATAPARSRRPPQAFPHYSCVHNACRSDCRCGSRDRRQSARQDAVVCSTMLSYWDRSGRRPCKRPRPTLRGMSLNNRDISRGRNPCLSSMRRNDILLISIVITPALSWRR